MANNNNRWAWRITIISRRRRRRRRLSWLEIDHLGGGNGGSLDFIMKGANTNCDLLMIIMQASFNNINNKGSQQNIANHNTRSTLELLLLLLLLLLGWFGSDANLKPDLTN